MVEINLSMNKKMIAPKYNEAKHVSGGSQKWESWLNSWEFSLFGSSYFQYRMITFVRETIKQNSKILEVGCGAGRTAAIFADMGYQVDAGDINEELITRATEKFGKLANFRVFDMFGLPYDDNTFELAYSQGVLEHFEDEAIIAAVKEQLRVAKYVLVDVPNSRSTINFGNERRISNTKWRSLLEEGGMGSIYFEGRDLVSHAVFMFVKNARLRRIICSPLWHLWSKTSLFWGTKKSIG